MTNHTQRPYVGPRHTFVRCQISKNGYGEDRVVAVFSSNEGPNFELSEHDCRIKLANCRKYRSVKNAAQTEAALAAISEFTE